MLGTRDGSLWVNGQVTTTFYDTHTLPGTHDQHVPVHITQHDR